MTLHDTKGSALIIALVVMTLLTMMSTVFFERIYSFSQRSEGIENSNVAYYKALGIIEDALYTGSVNKYTPWNIASNTYGSTISSGSKIIVSTWGTTIPIPWKWNSPYNKDYNLISIWSPVQIVIPEWIGWGSSPVLFEFRVPIIWWNTSTGVLASGTSSGYILWTLASSGVSLFASGETNIFEGYKINSVVPAYQRIDGFNGTTNSWSASTFNTFYTTSQYLGVGGSTCAGFKCTLKLSLIRTIPTTDGRNISFLEYKISGLNTAIPAQYMDIHAEGYAYGFLRSRDIQFPQITTNTALDFAVLQ